MEIDKVNFKKLCLLVRHEGFAICGQTNDGVMLENQNLTQAQAVLKLKRVCGNCGCHAPEGNCQPESENCGDASIFAKIK